MFAMIVQQATARRQQCGLPIRRIGVASIHDNICAVQRHLAGGCLRPS